MRTRSRVASAVVVLGLLFAVAYFATRSREQHEGIQVDSARDEELATRATALETAKPAASERATVASASEPASPTEVEASADTKLARVRFRPTSNDLLWSTALREHRAEAHFILVGASDAKSCLSAGLSPEGVAEVGVPEGARLFADAVHAGNECWIPNARSPLEFFGSAADCDVDLSQWVEVTFVQWRGPDESVAIDDVDVLSARAWHSEFQFEADANVPGLSFESLRRAADDATESPPAVDLCGAPPTACASPPSGPARLRRRFASERFWTSSPTHWSQQFAVPVAGDGSMTVPLVASGMLAVEVIEKAGAREPGLVLKLARNREPEWIASQAVVAGETTYFSGLSPGDYKIGLISSTKKSMVASTTASVTAERTARVQIFYPEERFDTTFTIASAPDVDLAIIRGGDLRFAPLSERFVEGTLVEESGVPLTWGPVEVLAGSSVHVALRNPPLAWTCTVAHDDPTIALPIRGGGTIGFEFAEAETRNAIAVDRLRWRIIVESASDDESASQTPGSSPVRSRRSVPWHSNAYWGEARGVESIDVPIVAGLIQVEVVAEGYGTVRATWSVVGDGTRIPHLVLLPAVTTIKLVPPSALSRELSLDYVNMVTLIDADPGDFEIVEASMELHDNKFLWVFNVTGSGPTEIQVPINVNGDTRRLTLELAPGTTQTVKL